MKFQQRVLTNKNKKLTNQQRGVYIAEYSWQHQEWYRQASAPTTRNCLFPKSTENTYFNLYIKWTKHSTLLKDPVC